MKRLTQEQFIERSRINHDGFDYSLTEYKNLRSLVTVICPKGHRFEQEADYHLYRSKGCPICTPYTGFDSQILKERVFKIFGDTLSVDRAVYINNNTPVIVTCKKHGDFTKKPSRLFDGIGCSKCRFEDRKQAGHNTGISQKDFFSRVPNQTKLRFNFDNTIYRGWGESISFICPTHGKVVLTQAVSLIKRSNPCDQCVCNEYAANFLQLAQSIHGNRYDYSLVKYGRSDRKVIVLCPNHGKFFVTPNQHINGIGCSGCSFSKGEIAITRFLEKNEIQFETQKRFSNCKLKAKLRFDFYLPLRNICIEYDGYWHFHPYRGDSNQFDLIQRRDRIKNIYCRENHIPLIRISNLKLIEPTLTSLLKL